MLTGDGQPIPGLYAAGSDQANVMGGHHPPGELLGRRPRRLAMLAVAEQHGVRILEVEYLTAWGTAADRHEAQQKKEQTVFHMARAFGVHHLNAGLLEKLPLDVMTDAFPALC